MDSIQTTVSENPHAAVAGGTTAVGTFLVWVVGRFGHITLSAEDGAAIAGGSSTILIYISKRGIKNVFPSIWRGNA
jgi:hypothetical protein